jgi:hypothetical protein
VSVFFIFHILQGTSALICKRSRYKYLQKPLEDNSLPTLLQYVNRWQPEQRDRFATTIGLLLAQGLASATCLQSLTKDHLVKNGQLTLLNSFFILPSLFTIRSLSVPVDLAVNVLTAILRSYLAEISMDHLAATLKKGGIKDLLSFFPPNRRSDPILDAHFRSAGLPQVADWWTRKQNALIKEDIAKAIKEALEREDEPSDVRTSCPFLRAVSRLRFSFRHSVLIRISRSLLRFAEL